MSITELPITGLPMGGVSPAVIVCGDPARADRIAGFLDDVTPLSDKREYRAHRGTYQGLPFTVCSHGIGAPGAAIAFEELILAGGQTFVRVGTCGGLQAGIQPGGLVIATAAVRNIGYGDEVAPRGYPAVADAGLTLGLQRAASAAGYPFHAGVVLSRDGFYASADAPAGVDYQTMSRARVQAVEMECAALFLVGSLRGARTAAILVADGNVLGAAESAETYKPGQDIVRAAIETTTTIALAALRETA